MTRLALLVAGALSAGCAAGFVEREVRVGGLELAGTLSFREGERAPAVVLVSGSGANDRDDTLGPNKPFRDLAHGLAARGIAVLRYDKRSHARPEAIAELGDKMTLREETIEDALAAAAFARAQPCVDPARVFVLGHSLGGTAIPRIARGDGELHGFVIMAGATRPLEQVIVDQLAFTAELDGTVDDGERRMLDRLRAQARRVAELEPGDDPPPSELPLAIPASYWLDLKAHPPAQLIAAETRPLLVLHADADYQATAADFAGWQRALAGKPNATFHRYRELNHLFMPATSRGPLDYRTPGHVAPEVIADLAAWIAANSR